MLWATELPSAPDLGVSCRTLDLGLSWKEQLTTIGSVKLQTEPAFPAIVGSPKWNCSAVATKAREPAPVLGLRLSTMLSTALGL